MSFIHPYSTGTIVLINSAWRRSRQLDYTSPIPFAVRLSNVIRPGDNYARVWWPAESSGSRYGGGTTTIHFSYLTLPVSLVKAECQECCAIIRTDTGVLGICEECVSHCESCQESVRPGATVTVNTDWRTAEEWCESCCDCDTFDCQHCGNVWTNSNSHSCNDCGDICESCASDLRYCEECDESYCDDYAHSDCGGSNDNQGTVYNYSYTPRLVFHGEGRRFLGLELECVSKRSWSTQVSVPDVTYCKDDSSIGGGGGFEIVSHPMTLAKFGELYPFDTLRQMYADGSRAHSSCGMHVHISRDAFTGPEHILRWFLLIYSNREAVQAVARRDSGQWASFSDANLVRDKAYGRRAGNRYQAINATNDATFEVRVFASTLNREKIMAALGLVDASAEYTRTLSTGQALKGALGWRAFMAWVDARPEYAALSAQARKTGTVDGPSVSLTRAASAYVRENIMPPAPPEARPVAPRPARPSIPLQAPGSMFDGRILGTECSCGCGEVWGQYPTSSDYGYWVSREYFRETYGVSADESARIGREVRRIDSALFA